MAEAPLCPACRKSRLSRYNRDPLCAPCMRDAQTVPKQATGPPAWLWDSSPWREALARVDLPSALTVFRAASRLSQYQLADITGWSQSTVSLFESGQRDTLYDIREWLRFADLIGMPREALLPLVLGRTDAILPDERPPGAALDDGGVLEETGLDVDRRAAGGLAAGLAVSVALPEATVPARVTSAHVRFLRGCVELIYERDQDVGGGAVLRQALTQFRRARAMLDDSEYSEQIGVALLLATADLAVAAGWVAYDSSRQALARQLYNEAELLAGTADDDELTAHVYANMSLQCTHLARVGARRGFAREGLRFADRVAEAAQRQPSPRLRTLAALRQATAHAYLGDEAAFRAAMTRAYREFDRGSHPSDPSWVNFVTLAEIIGNEAMGWAGLDSPDKADSLYRTLLADGNVSPRNRAYYHARLTGSLSAWGDSAQAIAEGISILRSLGREHIVSRRTFNELRPVRESGEKLGADEFCARFDAMERTLAS